MVIQNNFTNSNRAGLGTVWISKVLGYSFSLVCLSVYLFFVCLFVVCLFICCGLCICCLSVYLLFVYLFVVCLFVSASRITQKLLGRF